MNLKLSKINVGDSIESHSTIFMLTSFVRTFFKQFYVFHRMAWMWKSSGAFCARSCIEIFVFKWNRTHLFTFGLHGSMYVFLFSRPLTLSLSHIHRALIGIVEAFDIEPNDIHETCPCCMNDKSTRDDAECKLGIRPNLICLSISKIVQYGHQSEWNSGSDAKKCPSESCDTNVMQHFFRHLCNWCEHTKRRIIDFVIFCMGIRHIIRKRNVFNRTVKTHFTRRSHSTFSLHWREGEREK